MVRNSHPPSRSSASLTCAQRGDRYCHSCALATGPDADACRARQRLQHQQRQARYRAQTDHAVLHPASSAIYACKREVRGPNRVTFLSLHIRLPHQSLVLLFSPDANTTWTPEVLPCQTSTPSSYIPVRAYQLVHAAAFPVTYTHQSRASYLSPILFCEEKQFPCPFKVRRLPLLTPARKSLKKMPSCY